MKRIRPRAGEKKKATAKLMAKEFKIYVNGKEFGNSILSLLNTNFEQQPQSASVTKVSITKEGIHTGILTFRDQR